MLTTLPEHVGYLTRLQVGAINRPPTTIDDDDDVAVVATALLIMTMDEK